MRSLRIALFAAVLGSTALLVQGGEALVGSLECNPAGSIGNSQPLPQNAPQSDRDLVNALAVVAPEKVGLAPDRLARIARVVEEEIGKGKMPGAIVLVARRGKVAYFESFGFLDKAKGIRMSKDAIFRMYSMTKPFTSVAAMMLAEEGRLLLADPVSKWIPVFKAMQVAVPRADPATGSATSVSLPADREMTIHDLLRHTSGLVYPAFTSNEAARESFVKAGLDPSFDDRKLAPDEWISRLSKVLLAHQPGTTWEYGRSTDLLGRVIESVSGKRLGDFLAERVFGPLAMADAAFSVPAAKAARLAQPFAADPETGKPIEIMNVLQPPGNDSGGAGSVSTASDYFRFCEMLLEGGRLGTVRLLSRTTINLMTADHLGSRPMVPFNVGRVIGPEIEGYAFGLGFGVRLAPGIAGVPGSAGEYFWAGYGGTFFWIDPAEQLIVIYLSQAPGRSPVQLNRLIKQVVTQAIAD
jgi:CubicO group peptidase (beta-lactamase class C family)